MHIKITKSGPRRYVQLVESYRDSTGRVKKRTVATLGRLEHLQPELDSVINGLLKITGRDPLPTHAATMHFDSARALGDTWALNELWKALGLSRLGQVFEAGRYEMDVEALLRVMVFNRLCNPDSKLAVLRWLETVVIPATDTASMAYQHLLRAMDALIEHQHRVERCLTRQLRALIEPELAMVFYDLTTIRMEGHSTLGEELRQFGMAKEGMVARQILLGVVQTAEGLPIYHEVLPGNTAEAQTLRSTLSTVLERFPHVRRVVVIADRGLLNLDNLEELQSLSLPQGQTLEFIMAVPGRRYGEFRALLEEVHQQQACADNAPWVVERRWRGLRLVIAHDAVRAALQTQHRREQITSLEAQAACWAGKLSAQDEGVKARGRKLSDSGAKARFYRAVLEARLGHILKVDLKAELFSYHVDELAQQRAELMDGKLLLVTNTPEALTAAEVVSRYKSLADIERGFRVLKSEIEIGPVRHRLADRIRAHATICFLALLLYRVMRMRLKSAGSELSPERALESIRRIQYHQVWVGGQCVTGLSTMSPSQREVFDALRVKKPVFDRRLTVL
jgi:hypothetical protein